MKNDPIRFVVPLVTGFIIWLLAFFIVGYTQMPGGPEELYLPMVAVSTIIWIIIIIFVFWWYCKRWEISEEWLMESAVFGIIVMILQFALDIVSFIGFLGYTIETFVTDYLFQSTVLVMYPLVIVEVIVIAYLLKYFEKI